MNREHPASKPPSNSDDAWLNLSNVRRLADLFEREMLNLHEVCEQLREIAADPNCIDYLDILPTEVVEKLRDIAKVAWAHPEDVIYWPGASVVGDLELYQQHSREKRFRIYWGTRHLYQHFQPNQELPEFEPIRFVGTVEASLERDNSIYLFIDGNTMLFHDHPVHLVRPDGSMIVSELDFAGFITCDSDKDSPDRAVQRNGRAGYTARCHLDSVDDVPSKTRVLVDRTRLTTISPPPSYG